MYYMVGSALDRLRVRELLNDDVFNKICVIIFYLTRFSVFTNCVLYGTNLILPNTLGSRIIFKFL